MHPVRPLQAQLKAHSSGPRKQVRAQIGAMNETLEHEGLPQIQENFFLGVPMIRITYSSRLGFTLGFHHSGGSTILGTYKSGVKPIWGLSEMRLGEIANSA